MPDLRTSADHAALLRETTPGSPVIPALAAVTQALAAAESVQAELAMLALAALRPGDWPGDGIATTPAERDHLRGIVRRTLGLPDTTEEHPA